MAAPTRRGSRWLRPHSGTNAHFACVSAKRAFAEHIYTLSYRLDSWETALFDRRLRRQRGLASGERKTGVFLGSYGYLENVRPATTRSRIPDDSLPAPLRGLDPKMTYRVDVADALVRLATEVDQRLASGVGKGGHAATS